jgi:flagellar hook-basal body complex protein FliE
MEWEGRIVNNAVSSFSITPDMESLSTGMEESSESSEPSSSKQLMDSFGDTLTRKLGQVESLQQQAQSKMQKFAAGEIDDVHDVSISLQKASMGLNVATAVRRKVLQGISELQQMG